MIVLPTNEIETRNFCHWLDIIQVHPVTSSCFKRFELAEDKSFVFWLIDDKQFIMVHKDFPFPSSETFVSIEKFKDILLKNKTKYSTLIFTNGNI